ncbi:P1 family peptidase [Brevibacillus formosus]|uniref:Peptidase S58 n=2 Tax=Brevibacillus formosus TaxID=54913 RepID=A0ABQ0SZM4_9BACL|nr:P1 family peptidase [Brevibacillus formosus]MED1959425.1 P1 family peptidase [Brevibacillus formosus]GED56420.1 peptidase S58 [Brevibacillus formosus]
MAKDWKDAKQVQEKHEELLVKPSVTRRKFLQKTAMLGLAAAVPASLLTLGTAIGQEPAIEEGSSSKNGSPRMPKLASGTIVDVPGVKVGQVQNEEALTGCTVIVLEKGSACGVDVRGSAPGTRETDLLNPINSVQEVNAVVLTGGSAYGLDAASGVMRYMEEQGQGYNVGVGVVPIIPAAVIFDLSIGSAKIRPDQQMGYEAARLASKQPVQQGNVGAGTGATVGKMAGMKRAMKGGLGTASRRLPNGLVVGAIVAVNAVGEVRLPSTGEILAGARGEDGKIRESLSWMIDAATPPVPAGTNTTIAVVASNANLNKVQANKVAQMAHNGLAKTIHPVHTMSDGDTIFAIATGGVEASVNLVGTLSVEVLAEAVVNAILSAKGAGGVPAYQDLR